MKRSIFFSLFCLTFSFNLSSQSPNEARSVKATERMAKQLHLTAEQQVEIKVVYQKMYTEISELRLQKDSDINRTAARQNVKDEFEKNLAEILSAEQKEKWESENSDLKNKPKHKSDKGKKRTADATTSKRTPEDRAEHTRKMAAKKSARMAHQLLLSEEQEAKVYDAYLLQMTSAEELRNLAKNNHQAAHAARKEINATFEETIDQILTKEQKKRKQKMEQEQLAKRKEIKSSQRERR